MTNDEPTITLNKAEAAAMVEAIKYAQDVDALTDDMVYVLRRIREAFEPLKDALEWIK